MFGKSLLRVRVLVSSACEGFKNGRFSCQIVLNICVIPIKVTCKNSSPMMGFAGMTCQPGFKMVRLVISHEIMLVGMTAKS